jgi:hypothetical protein
LATIAAGLPLNAQPPSQTSPEPFSFLEPPEFGSVVESYPYEPSNFGKGDLPPYAFEQDSYAPGDFARGFAPPTRRPKVSRIERLIQNERAPFRLLTQYAPTQDVVDSADTLASRSIATQIGFPLQISENGILLGIASLKYTRLSSQAALPVSGADIPDELWDARAGVFITRDLNNGWEIGGLFNLGTASDQPFNSIDELTLTTLGFLNVPARERDSWIFSLFYSPTSQIRFPIPGIAYAWRPNDQWEAQIGLPASLTYAPNDRFSFRARYTPVTDVFVEARQMLDHHWSLFGRYQILNETYFLADRDDREDRFFVFEQQLAAGLSRQLPKGFSLELSAGYLFDRSFLQSDNFDLNAPDKIDVDAGVVYSMQVIWNL